MSVLTDTISFMLKKTRGFQFFVGGNDMTMILAVVFDILILLYFGSKVEVLDILLEFFTRNTARKSHRNRDKAEVRKSGCRAA